MRSCTELRIIERVFSAEETEVEVAGTLLIKIQKAQ